jgi:Fungal Zn(2)-Cys(6) binuclear cluster domain
MMNFGNLSDVDTFFAFASSSSPGDGFSDTSSSIAKQESPPDVSTPSTTVNDQSLIKVRRRPIPRKGHTKSRRGCFSCKKRKIKCPETLPKCENCVKAGMTCEYPRLDLATNQRPPEEPILQPQSTPTIFTANDMKYFHYFLMKAYPHLPVGADSLWTLEIPAQAHEASDY